MSDLHNFGRRVVVRGARVIKPRTMLWEWATLSRESPLRKALDACGDFDFLPALRFDLARSHVERISLRPMPARRHAELAAIVGRSLALWSWLGVSDLHWENLALGVDLHDRIVFAPLDIEMVFDDFSLPTRTKLIADAGDEYAALNRHAAGIRRALPYLGKPVGAEHLLSIAGAYSATLDLLDRQSRTLSDAIARLPNVRTTPIRVLLRATGDYVAGRSNPISPALLDAESEQLARGDIPYFTRVYGQPGIRFFRDERLQVVGRIPDGDAPPLDPLLSMGRHLRSPSRRRLREQGLLAVVGAFDHPSLTGSHRSDQIGIMLTTRRLKIDIAGKRLECRRDLSSVVGSAYLSCRCGEVRSVLAPKKTRCDRDS